MTTVSYAPTELNFEWYRGDTLEIDLYFTDVNDAPLQLQNFEAKLQVKNPKTNALLAEYSTTNNKISIIGNEGLIRIQDTAINMANIQWENGKYDLQLTKTSTGFVQTLLRGFVVVYKDVTV